MNKIFETNSSFYVQKPNMGKIQFPFFWNFLLVMTKFSIWEED